MFAEDEAVPIPLIARLWRTTVGLTEDQARTLCKDLERLSLLSLTPENCGQITLHDVIRDYLRSDLGEAALTGLHSRLVDSVAADLPPAEPLAPSTPDPGRAWWLVQEGYLLDHLIAHLVAAEGIDQAEAVAGDLRWLETRLAQRGPIAPWSDFTSIPSPAAAGHARTIAQAAHLLTPTVPADALINVLYSRLEPLPHWHAQVVARQQLPPLQPFLTNQWPPPDVPDPALQRLLTGHAGRVRSVAISPDGTWLATAYADGTVRLWDGSSQTLASGSSDPASRTNSVAFPPDGSWLATADGDGEVRLWDPTSRSCTGALTDTGPVFSVAISPDGTWLATASLDGTVRLWDLDSEVIATLVRTESPLHACVWTADGRSLAVAGARTSSLQISSLTFRRQLFQPPCRAVRFGDELPHKIASHIPIRR